MSRSRVDALEVEVAKLRAEVEVLKLALGRPVYVQVGPAFVSQPVPTYVPPYIGPLVPQPFDWQIVGNGNAAAAGYGAAGAGMVGNLVYTGPTVNALGSH